MSRTGLNVSQRLEACPLATWWSGLLSSICNLGVYRHLQTDGDELVFLWGVWKSLLGFVGLLWSAVDQECRTLLLFEDYVGQ